MYERAAAAARASIASLDLDIRKGDLGGGRRYKIQKHIPVSSLGLGLTHTHGLIEAEACEAALQLLTTKLLIIR